MRKHEEQKGCRLLFILLSGILYMLPFPSYGHVFPHHSEPKAGSTVAAAPDTVRIWFDGDLEPVFSKITIEDAGGRKVDKGNSQVDPADAKLLQVGVPALARGRYRVVWDVVSRDGHHTTGDFTFAVR